MFSSIGGYRNVINNSNKVLPTELVRQGVYMSTELSLLSQVRLQGRLNQNNGKENVIIRLNRPMARKMCLYLGIKSIPFPRKGIA